MLSVINQSFECRLAAWTACLAVGVALVVAENAHTAEVTITVADGRRFTAEIDPRSNAARLWLRFGTAQTTIQRPIEWSAVVRVRRDGVELTGEELKREIATATKASPPAAIPKSLVEPFTPKQETANVGGLRLWRVPGANSLPPLEPIAPVRSLAVDAYLANWDADVESDGLVVNFAALDDYGDSVPIDGSLEVELVGERQPPYSRGNAFPVLGRWTQQVTSADGTSPSGYTRVRLPFQAFDPEYVNSLPWFALAHVRLIVPGQGTFEASVDAVRLRGFTPVRDRMEAAAGTRFLPTEQSGRSKRLSSRGPVD